MRRLDGSQTETGRYVDGRFAPGNPGGPGRPCRDTERACLAAMAEAYPPETWKQIVETAVLHGGQGDRYAREWLASYLVGRSEGTAATLNVLVVDDLRRRSRATGYGPSAVTHRLRWNDKEPRS